MKIKRYKRLKPIPIDGRTYYWDAIDLWLDKEKTDKVNKLLMTREQKTQLDLWIKHKGIPPASSDRWRQLEIAFKNFKF